MFESRLFCFLLFLAHQLLFAGRHLPLIGWIVSCWWSRSQKKENLLVLISLFFSFARQQFYRRFIPIHASLQWSSIAHSFYRFSTRSTSKRKLKNNNKNAVTLGSLDNQIVQLCIYLLVVDEEDEIIKTDDRERTFITKQKPSIR